MDKIDLEGASILALSLPPLRPPLGTLAFKKTCSTGGSPRDQHLKREEKAFVNIGSSISRPDSAANQHGLLGDTAARDYARRQFHHHRQGSA